MMEQRTPFLIAIRLTKTVAVARNIIPLNQQKIKPCNLAIRADFNPAKARRSRNQGSRVNNRRFKCSGFTTANAEQGVLDYHA